MMTRLIWNLLRPLLMLMLLSAFAGCGDGSGGKEAKHGVESEDAGARAPVTTSPAVVANVTPSSTPLDGAALYASNCSSGNCHGALASSTKRGKTAAQIRSAINANTGGMGGLSTLTDAQLLAIETALK